MICLKCDTNRPNNWKKYLQSFSKSVVTSPWSILNLCHNILIKPISPKPYNHLQFSNYLINEWYNYHLIATDCQIVVNNERLNHITSAVHLGYCISILNKKSFIDAAGAEFWKGFNIFSADFGHLYTFLQYRLFTQYCCSFYGAPLWNFVHYNNIRTAWRKAFRKMWCVSPMTHCNIIIYFLRVSL